MDEQEAPLSPRDRATRRVSGNLAKCHTTVQKLLVRQQHPFNGPLSGTTRVSRYQKGTTNLDFTEARDSEWEWHQLGHMQVCTFLQTDNHASTPPLSFLQAGCPSCRPTNSVKALKAVYVFSIYLFSSMSYIIAVRNMMLKITHYHLHTNVLVQTIRYDVYTTVLVSLMIPSGKSIHPNTTINLFTSAHTIKYKRETVKI